MATAISKSPRPTEEAAADDGFDVAALLARMQTELGPDATAEAEAGPSSISKAC